MTEQELNELVAKLAALDAAATGAPWGYLVVRDDPTTRGIYAEPGVYRKLSDWTGDETDVELAIEARNALPALLEALQRARVGKALAEKNFSILGEVENERRRQDWRWGEQNHPDVDQVLMNRVGGCSPQRMAEHYEIPSAQRAKHLCKRAAAEEEVTFAHILLEEVCEAIEAATNRNTDATPQNAAALRTELIQVAAVVVAWVEKIDREQKGFRR